MNLSDVVGLDFSIGIQIRSDRLEYDSLEIRFFGDSNPIVLGRFRAYVHVFTSKPWSTEHKGLALNLLLDLNAGTKVDFNMAVPGDPVFSENFV